MVKRRKTSQVKRNYKSGYNKMWKKKKLKKVNQNRIQNKQTVNMKIKTKM